MNSITIGDAASTATSTASGSPPGDFEATCEFVWPLRLCSGDFAASDTDEGIPSNPIRVLADTANKEMQKSASAMQKSASETRGISSSGVHSAPTSSGKNCSFAFQAGVRGISSDAESAPTSCAKTRTSAIQKIKFLSDHTSLEIKFLSAQNLSMKTKIERLENLLGDNTVPPGFMRSATLQKNIEDYIKIANEMSDYLVSTQSRLSEEQNILREAAYELLNIKLESRRYTDGKSLTDIELAEFENALRNYHKRLMSAQFQILDDKQKTFDAEKQYQKILFDYRQLASELDSANLDNERLAAIALEKEERCAAMEQNLDERNKELSEERASLSQQQKKLNDDKARVHAQLECITQRFQSLEQEKKKMLDVLKAEHENYKQMFVSQRLGHLAKTALKDRQTLVLKRRCSEFADEIKLRQEQYDSLQQDNILLRSKLDIIQMDLDSFKSEMSDAYKKIAQLQIQHDEFQEAASEVECKIQLEEQERRSLLKFDYEMMYLHQIEKLANENRKLREENMRLKN